VPIWRFSAVSYAKVAFPNAYANTPTEGWVVKFRDGVSGVATWLSLHIRTRRVI